MVSDDPVTWILSGYAFISALLHFIDTKSLEKYAIDQGMLAADRSVKISALLLLVLGVLFLLNDFSQYAAYGLSGFLAVSALTVHKFWLAADNRSRVSELLHFVKNFFFGALILAYFLAEQS